MKEEKDDKRLSRKPSDSFYLSDTLDAVFKKHNISFSDPFISLCRSWDEFVGTQLRGKTRIREIKSGFLLVEVSHPAWATVLDMDKKKIMEKIIKNYPTLGIKGIKAIVI